jgi:glycosyltransferase involved in cell wall biosynthesis
MKVVIALASSSAQLSGVQRHAINVARCLLTRGEITAVYLIAAPWQIEFIRNLVPRNETRLCLHAAPIGRSALSRNWWYYTHLPEVATELQSDIVHLAYPAPLRISAFHCPTVVTLHDLYPFDVPGNFGFPKVLFNQLVLRQCLRDVDAVACVSASTLSRLEYREPRLALGKAVTIYNCVEPHPHVSSHTPLPQGSGHPFLLSVAQHRRNKNIPFLLRVFKRLLQTGQLSPGTRLVIVGIQGPETNAILRFLTAEKLTQKVDLLHGLSDAELQWCYRNCELLLAPSIVEGFGLPIAEALLAGCHVICSDIAAFREVGGDHCHYIPLDSKAEQAFATAVLAVLGKPRFKPITLPQLSAPVIAEEYLRLYESLLLSASASSATLPRASAQNLERNQPHELFQAKRRG